MSGQAMVLVVAVVAAVSVLAGYYMGRESVMDLLEEARNVMRRAKEEEANNRHLLNAALDYKRSADNTFTKLKAAYAKLGGNP